MIREAAIERRVREKCPALNIKLITSSGTGWPDRLVILPQGRVLWLELKRPGGVLSVKQVYTIAKLRGLGHDVVVAYSADEALTAIMERMK